jgi:preprotein translocase subunit SecA
MTIDQVWKEHLYSMDQLKDAIRFHGYAQKDPLMMYKNEGYKLFESCLEKIATLTMLRILNIRITLPNGVTVSPDQLQLKSQEQIEAEKKAAEEAKNAAGEAEASEPAENAEQSEEQLSAEGAKAAGLAGQAAASETNAISEEQPQQPMPQSALPGTRQTQRTYTNPAVAAAARKRAQQAGPKLGRNDPCWCGSGLKYKKCHGKDLE